MSTTITPIPPGSPPAVTLDRDMVWVDEYTADPQKIGTMTNTIGGGVNIQEYAKTGGRLMTLQSQDGMGRQRKSTIDALKLHESELDREFTISINSKGIIRNFTVRYRPDIDGGAVQFEMATPFDGNQKDTKYYDGTLYLVIV